MIAALALVVALLGGGSVAAEAESRLRPAPCSQFPWEESTEAREDLIRCAARHWEVPGGPEKALAVARCESYPWLDPRASYGPHRGIYQHVLSLWPDRAERYLARWFENPRAVSPYNALANVLVTIQMVHDPGIGWGPWSCA